MSLLSVQLKRRCKTSWKSMKAGISTRECVPHPCLASVVPGILVLAPLSSPELPPLSTQRRPPPPPLPGSPPPPTEFTLYQYLYQYHHHHHHLRVFPEAVLLQPGCGVDVGAFYTRTCRFVAIPHVVQRGAFYLYTSPRNPR